jgi:RimJ/RimL family protein N-acetyltransferase
MPVPVIETERLTLRGHRREDFEACAAMWSDPLVTRFITGKPSTEQQTWMRVLAYAGHWSLLGFGYWAIEEKASGAFAGELGFADFRRAIAAPWKGVPEAGWALVPSFHGKGYAAEALSAIVAWGDRHFEGGRTICLIDPENRVSVRLAEKCGYRQHERVTLGENSVLVFVREFGGR